MDGTSDSRMSRGSGRRRESLLEIGGDIVEILQSYRKSHQSIGDTRGQPALAWYAVVSGARRVRDQAANITEAHSSRAQLDVIEQACASRQPALQLEDNDTATTTWHLPSSQLVLGM